MGAVVVVEGEDGVQTATRIAVGMVTAAVVANACVVVDGTSVHQSRG